MYFAMSDVEDCLLYLALAISAKRKKYKRKIKRRMKRILMENKQNETQQIDSSDENESKSENANAKEHQAQSAIQNDNSPKQESQNGENPVQGVQVNAVSALNNFMGIDMVVFDELCCLLEIQIRKRTNFVPQAISAKEKLYKTLRFLENGDFFMKIDYAVSAELEAVGAIVLETCADIIEALKTYIKLPRTAFQWQLVATAFTERWQFPNCLGAIAAKHVSIKSPDNDKAGYFNPKMFFSVTLIALVNANHEFMVVEVDTKPRKWDGDAYARSEFGNAALSGDLKIPESSLLPSSVKNLPYVFVSKYAFELNKNVMMPYAKVAPLSETKQIFNYRLDRAYRCAENALGLMASRFGIFHGSIHLEPEKVKTVVLACCYLHNYLVRKAPQTYIPEGALDVDDNRTGTVRAGDWRERWKELTSLQPGNTQKTADAHLVRKLFAEYFVNEGKLFWQNKFITP